MQAASAATRRDKSPGDACVPRARSFFGVQGGGGMGGELIVDRAVLLVIDMQQAGFLPVETAGIPLMDGYADRIERVVSLVDRCRATGVPVIFFQEVHRRDGVDFGRELDGTEGVHCLEGDPGTELVEELRPMDGD